MNISPLWQKSVLSRAMTIRPPQPPDYLLFSLYWDKVVEDIMVKGHKQAAVMDFFSESSLPETFAHNLLPSLDSSNSSDIDNISQSLTLRLVRRIQNVQSRELEQYESDPSSPIPNHLAINKNSMDSSQNFDFDSPISLDKKNSKVSKLSIASFYSHGYLIDSLLEVESDEELDIYDNVDSPAYWKTAKEQYDKKHPDILNKIQQSMFSDIPINSSHLFSDQKTSQESPSREHMKSVIEKLKQDEFEQNLDKLSMLPEQIENVYAQVVSDLNNNAKKQDLARQQEELAKLASSAVTSNDHMAAGRAVVRLVLGRMHMDGVQLRRPERIYQYLEGTDPQWYGKHWDLKRSIRRQLQAGETAPEYPPSTDMYGSYENVTEDAKERDDIEEYIDTQDELRDNLIKSIVQKDGLQRMFLGSDDDLDLKVKYVHQRGRTVAHPASDMFGSSRKINFDNSEDMKKAKSVVKDIKRNGTILEIPSSSSGTKGKRVRPRNKNKPLTISSRRLENHPVLSAYLPTQKTSVVRFPDHYFLSQDSNPTNTGPNHPLEDLDVDTNSMARFLDLSSQENPYNTLLENNSTQMMQALPRANSFAANTDSSLFVLGPQSDISGDLSMVQAVDPGTNMMLLALEGRIYEADQYIPPLTRFAQLSDAVLGNSFGDIISSDDVLPGLLPWRQFNPRTPFQNISLRESVKSLQDPFHTKNVDGEFALDLPNASNDIIPTSIPNISSILRTADDPDLALSILQNKPFLENDWPTNTRTHSALVSKSTSDIPQGDMMDPAANMLAETSTGLVASIGDPNQQSLALAEARFVQQLLRRGWSKADIEIHYGMSMPDSRMFGRLSRQDHIDIHNIDKPDEEQLKLRESVKNNDPFTLDSHYPPKKTDPDWESFSQNVNAHFSYWASKGFVAGRDQKPPRPPQHFLDDFKAGKITTTASQLDMFASNTWAQRMKENDPEHFKEQVSLGLLQDPKKQKKILLDHQLGEYLSDALKFVASSDPSLHDLDDTGKYYHVANPKEIYPHGISGTIEKEWTLFQSNAVMVRQPAIWILDWMRDFALGTVDGVPSPQNSHEKESLRISTEEFLQGWKPTGLGTFSTTKKNKNKTKTKRLKKLMKTKISDISYDPNSTFVSPLMASRQIYCQENNIEIDQTSGMWSEQDQKVLPGKALDASLIDSVFRKPILLDGSESTGKSTILNHVVHFGRRAEWIVIHIPNPKDWFKGDSLISEYKLDGKTLFADEENARKYLKELAESYKTLFSNLKLPNPDKLVKEFHFRDGSPEADTAADQMLAKIESENPDLKLSPLELEEKQKDASHELEILQSLISFPQEDNADHFFLDLDINDKNYDQEQLLYDIGLQLDQQIHDIGDPVPKTFGEFIEWGLMQYMNGRTIQTQVFRAVIDQLSQLTEIPVLFAVDDYNSILAGESEYLNPPSYSSPSSTKKNPSSPLSGLDMIPNRKLALLEPFSDLVGLASKSHRALVVAATSCSSTSRTPSTLKLFNTTRLGKQFQQESFHYIPVLSYSYEEMETALIYYYQKNHLQGNAQDFSSDPSFIQSLYATTGGRPGQVFTLLAKGFQPLPSLYQ